MIQDPIGIYDSGLGGLSVLKEFAKAFPHKNFLYFADTAHLPYGQKSPEEILLYSYNIVQWLQTQKSCLIVAACHTSSALALESIEKQCSTPLIGTIYPMVHTLISRKSKPRLGIIATLASAQSRTHERIFKKHGFSGEILTLACPDFVPFVESGTLEGPVVLEKAMDYLLPFKAFQPHLLLYGCTHYPFLAQTIHQAMEKLLTDLPLPHPPDQSFTPLPESTKPIYLNPAHSMVLEACKKLHLPMIESNPFFKDLDDCILAKPTDRHLSNSFFYRNTSFYCSGNPQELSQKIGKLLTMPPPVVKNPPCLTP
jgi:glutamate racemase